MALRRNDKLDYDRSDCKNKANVGITVLRDRSTRTMAGNRSTPSQSSRESRTWMLGQAIIHNEGFRHSLLMTTSFVSKSDCPVAHVQRKRILLRDSTNLSLCRTGCSLIAKRAVRPEKGGRRRFLLSRDAAQRIVRHISGRSRIGTGPTTTGVGVHRNVLLIRLSEY